MGRAKELCVSDRRRFERLVLPHLDAGYNLARWLTRNAADADDVVQDACIRALRYLTSLQGEHAKPWFLTIVRHAFYDWCGRNRPQDLAPDGAAALESAVDDTGIGPEEAAQTRDEAKALTAAIAALPLVYREVLVMREMEDLSYKEIARIADIPIGTVMSRLARARALLQRSALLQVIGEQRREGMR